MTTDNYFDVYYKGLSMMYERTTHGKAVNEGILWMNGDSE